MLVVGKLILTADIPKVFGKVPPIAITGLESDVSKNKVDVRPQVDKEKATATYTVDITEKNIVRVKKTYWLKRGWDVRWDASVMQKNPFLRKELNQFVKEDQVQYDREVEFFANVEKRKQEFSYATEETLRKMEHARNEQTKLIASCTEEDPEKRPPTEAEISKPYAVRLGELGKLQNRLSIVAFGGHIPTVPESFWAKQEAEKQEAEKQEAEKQEAEKQEAEKQEAE